MKRTILVLVVGAFIALIATLHPAAISPSVAGCSWWNQGGGSQTVVSQIEQEGACVLAQVESGNVDPISVAVACTGALLGSLTKDIEAILAFYTQPAPAPDGGAATPALVGAMCGAPGAAPPYKGAPTWLSMKVLSDLRAMHAQSKAAIAAGAK